MTSETDTDLSCWSLGPGGTGSLRSRTESWLWSARRTAPCSWSWTAAGGTSSGAAPAADYELLKKKKNEQKKTFSHTSGVCEPYKHLTRLEKGVGMSVSHRDEEEAAIELFLWKLQQSAAAVAMATAAANNTGSC